MEEIFLDRVPAMYTWKQSRTWANYKQQCTAPQEAGYYVFTNYTGLLISNNARRDFPIDINEAMAGKYVLYVGRATNLHSRLNDYIAEKKCSPDLLSLLKRHPDSIWVRWTEDDDLELGLIVWLKPEFNKKLTKGSKIDVSLNWSTPKKWRAYCRAPNAPKGIPGLYVFTGYPRPLRPSDRNSNVFYIGRSHDLYARMGDYLQPINYGDSCNPQIFDWLRSHADDTWVRWAKDFDGEEELIASLNPVINIIHNEEGVYW